MKTILCALLSAFILISLVRAADPPPATEKPKLVFDVKVETDSVPEMKEYGEKVQKIAEQWYPIIVDKLPSDGFVPTEHVVITFKKDMKGVAYTAGNHVVCAPKWFTDHPEDLGAIVHELVHVVQHYQRGRRPGWLVEGIADYIRFYQYEPEKARPHPNPARAKYSDSYRTTAHFLNWCQEKYDKNLVVKLNAACRNAKYSDDLWKEYTGKTLAELGQEWKDSLQPKADKPAQK